MGLLDEAWRRLIESLSQIVTAVFKRKTFHTTVKVDGSGSTTPAPGEYDTPIGDTLSIQATPAAGWEFDHWTKKDGTTTTENPLKVTA